jgi:hypothetical protein
MFTFIHGSVCFTFILILDRVEQANHEAILPMSAKWYGDTHLLRGDERHVA